MEPIAYELKYCERCGALGLRRACSSESYCEPCEKLLLHHFLPEQRSRRWMRRAKSKLPVAQPDPASATSGCRRVG